MVYVFPFSCRMHIKATDMRRTRYGVFPCPHLFSDFLLFPPMGIRHTRAVSLSSSFSSSNFVLMLMLLFWVLFLCFFVHAVGERHL